MESKNLNVLPETEYEPGTRHIVKLSELLADRSLYVSYYENVYGESFIFVYDKKTSEAYLIGDETGWEKSPIETYTGRPLMLLNSFERAWLNSCWMTVENSLGFKKYKENN